MFPSTTSPDVVLCGSTATLSVLDRGLQYGDGLFETIAVRAGRPCQWGRHLARLQAGAERLGIPLPDSERLLEAALAEIRGLDAAVLKVMLTRGSGGRGYRAPDPASPRGMLYTTPWPEFPPDAAARGVAVRTCALRLAEQPVLAGIKHLNRLEQVLARREWDDPGIHEGLLLDTAGRVIEGISANLLLFRDGVMVTPALDRCGVAGVVRGLALEIAPRLGLRVEVRDVAATELPDFSSMALTNSLIGVWPIATLDGRTLSPPDRVFLDTLAAESFRC